MNRLGLRAIVDSTHDGEIRTLADPRVLRSIRTLFAERLDGDVHLCRTTLEYVCFLFWDIAPVGPLGDAVLDALAVDSAACEWAALHGLGHAYHDAPEQVRDIVDGWLRRHRGTSPALRDYAELARTVAVN